MPKRVLAAGRAGARLGVGETGGQTRDLCQSQVKARSRPPQENGSKKPARSEAPPRPAALAHTRRPPVESEGGPAMESEGSEALVRSRDSRLAQL